MKAIEEIKAPSQRRLLEVDFFRGAAILVIFWNHLLLLTQTAGYLARSPFRIHYGYSDSAAVFVFLSGFVSGIVYNKHLTGYGYLHTQMKALRRSGQIYGAQLVTLGVLVTCAFLWQDRGSLDPLRHQLQDFAVHPISEGLGLISLQSCLDYVDILPFYIVILAFVPLALVGFRKFPVLTLLLSAFTYAAIQVFKALNYVLWMPDWFVNPFAWQFLFILGLYLGFRRQNNTLTIPRKRILTLFASAVAIFSFIKIPWLQSTLGQSIPSVFGPIASLEIPWIYKEFLEPVFFLHFVCLAYLVWIAAPKFKMFLSTSIARPFVITGQHSLFLYCLVTILDYVLAHFVVQAGGKVWIFLSAELLGVCILIGTAMAFWSRPAQQSSPLLPAAKPLTRLKV